MPSGCGTALLASMHLIMLQPDVVGVAHFVIDSSDLLGAAIDAHNDGYSNSAESSSSLFIQGPQDSQRR